LSFVLYGSLFSLASRHSRDEPLAINFSQLELSQRLATIGDISGGASLTTFFICSNAIACCASSYSRQSSVVLFR